MKIILVRHGETVFNRDSRYQGHTDAELSDLGRMQALSVAEYLRPRTLHAVYSSDLSRAFDTAEAIASRHGLTTTTLPELRECAFGEWEGLTVTEIREKYPILYADYRRDSITHRAPGGERLEELQARTIEVVERIAEGHPHDTIAIVTHGGPIRSFLCYALGVGLQAFRRIGLANAGVTILDREIDGRWVLQVMNDHGFMSEYCGDAHDETAVAGKR